MQNNLQFCINMCVTKLFSWVLVNPCLPLVAHPQFSTQSLVHLWQQVELSMENLWAYLSAAGLSSLILMLISSIPTGGLAASPTSPYIKQHFILLWM